MDTIIPRPCFIFTYYSSIYSFYISFYLVFKSSNFNVNLSVIRVTFYVKRLRNTDVWLYPGLSPPPPAGHTVISQDPGKKKRQLNQKDY